MSSSHIDIMESAVIAQSNLRVDIQRKEVLLVLVMRHILSQKNLGCVFSEKNRPVADPAKPTVTMSGNLPNPCSREIPFLVRD